MKTFRRSGLAAAALLSFGLPCLALSPAPPPTPQKLDAQECIERGTAEGRWKNSSGLRVHQRLASHLSQLRVEKQHPLDEYRCEGAGLAYHARITDQAITVESRYLQEGKQHSSTSYLGSSPTDGYREAQPHGIQRVNWPDGRLQSVEFYCQGQPVGFHRYYDATGRLLAIADHSSSDYRAERRLNGRRTLITRADQTLQGFLTGPVESPIGIRKLYEVHGARLDPALLQWRERPFHYSALDSGTRLEQLVTEGDQGWISEQGQRVRIVNAPMDYMPFWEVYERDRKRLPDGDPVEARNRKILACPWLDEAMKPPLSQAALARPRAAALTDAQRHARPRARYLACLQRPSETCLMPSVLPLALNEWNYGGAHVRSAAAAAIEMRQPELASDAIERLFDKERVNTAPTLRLAIPELMRARTAVLQGDVAGAELHARASLVNAQAPAPTTDGAALGLDILGRVGLELARMGYPDLATKAYEQLTTAHAQTAIDVLSAVGEAHARAGRREAAASVAAQLRMRKEHPLPDHLRDGGPVRWYSARAAHVHALALVAQALAQQGRTGEAQELLAQAQAEWSRASGQRYPSNDAELALALAQAALGDSAAAQRLADRAYGVPWAHTRNKAWAVLCDAGRANFVADRRVYHQPPYAAVTPIRHIPPYGALASAHVRCGQVQQARDLLEQGMQYAQEKAICNAGMWCPWVQPPDAMDLIALSMLEAGQVDMLETWSSGRTLGTKVHIRWAEQLAKGGNQDAARHRLATASAQALVVPEELRIDLLLAKAWVEGGEVQPTLALLEDVYATASAIDAPHRRALALLSVARTFNAAGATARARELLSEARAGFDSILDGSLWRTHANVGEFGLQLGLVAQEFVAAGSLDEALRTVHSLYLQPGTLAAQHRAERLAGRVDAAIVENQSAAMAPTQEVRAAFAALPPGSAKAQVLDAAMRQAASGQQPLAAAAWQALSQEALQSSDAYLANAASSLERRTQLGLMAGWLRLDLQRHQGTEEEQSQLRALQLERLATHARRIDSAAWRARSLCELGFTGIALGLPAGKPLLQEGTTLAAQYNGKAPPLDPPPTGACAYWSLQAGEKAAAAALVDWAVEPLRAPVRHRPDGLLHPTSARDLINTSIALFEAAHGELVLDWRRGYWRD